MNVLVTGGTGFIGSHQVVSLIENNHRPVIVDDCSNSFGQAVVERIAEITGSNPAFVRLDVRDTERLHSVMQDEAIDAVMHFAAKKHVPESTTKPVEYARVNIDGLGSVIESAHEAGIRRMVFSSSGSVYGNADELPISESAPHRPTNPYSDTKAFGERLLQAHCKAHPDWRVIALRYFNPAGAHPSGLLGEDPSNLVSNLLPSLMLVACGQREFVEVFGDDYPTPDGTGVRDYVHVVDVAEAHVRALSLLDNHRPFEAINIGRGEGVSVRQLIDGARLATERDIPVVVRERRPGDVAALYGDTTLARSRLGLTEYRSILTICEDAWRFTVKNSNGDESPVFRATP